MLRYRDNGGGLTRISLRALRNLPKLGTIRRVRGYRYRSKYGLEEAVMVYGDKGTARFEGFLWGYGGTGPNGLVQLLEKVGMDRPFAEEVAFKTPRGNKAGTDWELTPASYTTYRITPDCFEHYHVCLFTQTTTREWLFQKFNKTH